MKKVFTILIVSLFCVGISFGSFQVKKQQKDASATSVTVEKTQDDLSAISNTLENGVIENAEVSSEEIVSSEAETKSKSKAGDDSTVAIILAIVSVLFLPFGLHNWYLGRTKQALWQTLMVFPGIVLLGIPALASWIWQIVDMFRLIINGTL